MRQLTTAEQLEFLKAHFPDSETVSILDAYKQAIETVEEAEEIKRLADELRESAAKEFAAAKYYQKWARIELWLYFVLIFGRIFIDLIIGALR